MTHWASRKLGARFWAGEDYGLRVLSIVYRVLSFFFMKEEGLFKSFSSRSLVWLICLLFQKITRWKTFWIELSHSYPLELFFRSYFSLIFLLFWPPASQVKYPGVLAIFWNCAFQHLCSICLFNRIWSLVFFHLYHGWSMIIRWAILCLELLKLWKTVKLMGNI